MLVLNTQTLILKCQMSNIIDPAPRCGVMNQHELCELTKSGKVLDSDWLIDNQLPTVQIELD